MEIFLLGLFIGVVWWMHKRHDERERAKHKRCPHCAETILAGARVCRFCHRELMPPVNSGADTTAWPRDDRPHHLGRER